jgi:hypothetical protein
VIHLSNILTNKQKINIIKKKKMNMLVNNTKADQDHLFNTEGSFQLETLAGSMNNLDTSSIFLDIHIP